ncbi:MAG: hypothetical protein KZQ58_09650 [gamma proteobacterium symbiont of Bathyaustriella thionipta]|nr:hypothetical protein [gamma proteobacterium symbiont of Bathyaustriella thionipta]
MNIARPVRRYFLLPGMLAVYCMALLLVLMPCAAQDAVAVKSEISLLEAAREDLLAQIERVKYTSPVDDVQLDSLNTHLKQLDARIAQARQSLHAIYSNGGHKVNDPTQLNDRRASTRHIVVQPLPDSHAALYRLDEQLTQSIGVFDEHLLQETELARQQAEHSSSQSGSASSSAGGQEQGQGEGSQSAAASSGNAEADHKGVAGEKENQAKQSRSGGQASSEGSERNAHNTQQVGQTASTKGGDKHDSSAGGRAGGNGPSRSKPIPSGDDDDIVARQLREAAERETDPQLKERLWDEYRKYKQG